MWSVALRTAVRPHSARCTTSVAVRASHTQTAFTPRVGLVTRAQTSMPLARVAGQTASGTARAVCPSPHFHVARLHQLARLHAAADGAVSPSPASASALSAAPATDASSPLASKPKRRTIKTLRYDMLQWLSVHAPWVREWCALVKIELSFVVTMSSLFGCMMAGMDAWSTPHVIANFVGTAMCASSAAIFNQWREVPYDRLMKRTSSRPLVTGAIKESHALTAALTLPVAGAALLHYSSAGDWVAPVLGIGTIVGYACIYTPWKRVNRFNTEFGAIVGAVPVLIGWSCAISHWTHHMAVHHEMHLPFSTLMSLTMPHALCGFLFLGAWQMQHFMTIAYQFQEQYAAAGYQMIQGDAALHKGMAWTAVLCALPFGAVYFGVASSMLLVTGSAINGMLVYSYAKWWRAMRDPKLDQAARNSAARSCMLFGIIYFLIMFPALIYHSLDNKYHLFTNLVPAQLRQAALAFCPWPTVTATRPDGAKVALPAQEVGVFSPTLNPNIAPCPHKHTQNDRKCVYMRLVKQETLDQLEPKQPPNVAAAIKELK